MQKITIAACLSGLILSGLSFLIIACQPSTIEGRLMPTVIKAVTPDDTLGNSGESIQDFVNDVPIELERDQSTRLKQWAIEAKASSEYAVPEWSEDQATGAPDTKRCGDYQTAWTSAGSDSQETLVLTYTKAVHATEVNIVQTFNPNQVVKVELIDQNRQIIEVYSQAPVQIDQPCPFILSIKIKRTDSIIRVIRLHLDQSVLGLGWNEIDAVELVGNEN